MKLFVQFVVVGLAVVAIPFPLAGKPAALPNIPVTVGAKAELNACTSIGHGIAALIVRSAPSVSAHATVKLGRSHLVWICEQRDDAKWYGIVYGAAGVSHGKNGVPPKCGVSTPITKPKTYRGPCKSGWVPADAVEMIAG